MNPTLEGVVTVMYVRSGVAEKSKKPYAMFANGRKEFFLTPSTEQLEILKQFKENEVVEIEVSTVVGSDTVTLLEVRD